MTFKESMPGHHATWVAFHAATFSLLFFVIIFIIYTTFIICQLSCQVMVLFSHAFYFHIFIFLFAIIITLLY